MARGAARAAGGRRAGALMASSSSMRRHAVPQVSHSDTQCRRACLEASVGRRPQTHPSRTSLPDTHPHTHTRRIIAAHRARPLATANAAGTDHTVAPAPGTAHRTHARRPLIAHAGMPRGRPPCAGRLQHWEGQRVCVQLTHDSHEVDGLTLGPMQGAAPSRLVAPRGGLHIPPTTTQATTQTHRAPPITQASRTRPHAASAHRSPHRGWR